MRIKARAQLETGKTHRVVRVLVPTSELKLYLLAERAHLSVASVG